MQKGKGANFKMRNENNLVTLEGEINSSFQFSHDVFGEGFYTFDLKTNRLSGNYDLLPILVSERLINVKESAVGALVRIEGQLRSFNQVVDGKSHTILSIFVNDIENIDEESFANNLVSIQGFICKPPVYRRTPSEKDICDLFLAVNRPYGRTDYIPCISWGRDAVYTGTLPVGTELRVVGRFQSREYSKRMENGEFEIKTAFELSVQKMEVVNNECEN
jgi:hypothetical protein